MLHHFIDSLLFSLLYPVMLIGMLTGGYLIAHFRYKKKGRIWTPSGTEAPIIGFFALLLSFTFLSSNNVMRDRIKLIHNEADAVANLRRQSLWDSDEIKNITHTFLIHYVDRQIAFYSASDYEEAANIKRQTEQLDRQYLTDILKMRNNNAGSKSQLQLLCANYNDLNSSFHAITYSYAERMPLLIIWLLVVASLLISMLVGFMNGFYEGGKHLLVPLIFVVLVTLSIQVIRDMDDPLRGTIKPETGNLQDIKTSLIKDTG